MPPTSPPGPSALPALGGAALALASAILFGLTTPLVQAAGAGIGPFTTAALLYAGAALAGALLRRPAQREARLRRADAPRVLAVAALGAALAPAALAWGLQRTSAASASLALTLEVLFTALSARLLYHEHLGPRVRAAMVLLLGGGVLLAVDQGRLGGAQAGGLAAVLLATAAWGVDNALSRALADRDPGQVVLAKASLGAAATTTLALLATEPHPGSGAALALLAIGATGYGFSLRLYLLAQRAFGAARTASVFAFAPFVGAAAALLWTRQGPGALPGLGAVLMLAGVLLHLAERHAHLHEHEAQEHEHAHTHDDGHHGHGHGPADPAAAAAGHSHRHRHAPDRHAHAHVPDLHHGHRH